MIHHVFEELQPEPLAPESVISGNPEVSSITLEEGVGGSSGLWRITPGVVTDTEVEESFLVLTGRGTLKFEDRPEVNLVPGVLHRFQGGEQTTWIIEETLTKAWQVP